MPRGGDAADPGPRGHSNKSTSMPAHTAPQPSLAYVVVGDFAWEGLSVEAVSLDRQVAERRRDELNIDRGDDPADPDDCRFKVYSYPLLENQP